MASTDDIPGENQTIEIYATVLRRRVEAFHVWVKENHPLMGPADESDWDNEYQFWLENVEQRL